MEPVTKRTASTFFFDLAAEFLPHGREEENMDELPISDAAFYKLLSILSMALILLAVVFR